MVISQVLKDLLDFWELLEIHLIFEINCKKKIASLLSLCIYKAFFFMCCRHDVTEGTRELIKDTTADIKVLSQSQTTDPKKTVSLFIYVLHLY